MEETKELMVQQNQNVGVSIFSSKDAFELGQRMARVFSESTLVPKQYQKNIGNCIIALNMAARMKSEPLMVMQNLVIVHNVPTFEAKFAIACFNATGRYSAIKYKEEGKPGTDSWGFRAYAIEKTTGDVVEGPLVTIGTAKSEGWYAQNPKWKNVPELMLRYRAASWFIRTTDPGVMMGFQTREEVEDYTDFVEVEEDPEKTFEPTDDGEKTVIDMDAEKEQAEETSETEKPADTKATNKQEIPDIFK